MKKGDGKITTSNCHKPISPIPKASSKIENTNIITEVNDVFSSLNLHLQTERDKLQFKFYRMSKSNDYVSVQTSANAD